MKILSLALTHILKLGGRPTPRLMRTAAREVRLPLLDVSVRKRMAASKKRRLTGVWPHCRNFIRSRASCAPPHDARGVRPGSQMGNPHTISRGGLSGLRIRHGLFRLHACRIANSIAGLLILAHLQTGPHSLCT